VTATGSFASGEVVLLREVLNDGQVWLVSPVRVVADTSDLLALYLAEGTPFGFPEGDFPGGPHPWSGRDRWHGHGVLMLHHPGDMHGVWVFWEGAEREFAGWYLNIQEPPRRWRRGFDTQDLELDLVLAADEPGYVWKDVDLLERREREGRYTPEQVAEVRAEGARIAARLDRGERWWDEAWSAWEPDPSWAAPELPSGWQGLAGGAEA
jgi:hypothetical protein